MLVKGNKGFSLVDSLFALLIIGMIVTALMPKIIELQQSIEWKIVDVNAVEAALNGARLARDYQQYEGTITIEKEPFHWVYQEGEICVKFYKNDHEEERCFSND